MVGHTGVIPAAVKAVETVDACLADVVAAVHAKGGACIVTADHGNADHMLEPDGSPEHRALAEPGAAGRHRRGAGPARRRRAGRRRADRARPARGRPAAGDDRRVADRPAPTDLAESRRRPYAGGVTATARTGDAPARLRLAEMLAALALATDAGTGFPLDKSLRTAIVAVRLGERAGLSADALADVYYVALLRSIGCTAYTPETAALLGGDDIAFHTLFEQLDPGRPVVFVRDVMAHMGEWAPPVERARSLGRFLTVGPREGARRAAPRARSARRSPGGSDCPPGSARDSSTSTSAGTGAASPQVPRATRSRPRPASSTWLTSP